MDVDVTSVDGYLPILYRIQDEPCLVVGGGPVAERRVMALLEAHARVRVVSPLFTPGLELLVRDGRIEGFTRYYEPSDQEGMRLVVAATNDPDVNEAICREAQAQGRLVNRAERPELGDFLMPAVVRRGKLVIAVSTQGASPTVAAKIRRQIEETIGEEYEIYLDFLQEYRLKVQQLVKDTKQRQELFRNVLDEDILGKIRDGQFQAWRNDAEKRLLSEAERLGQVGWEA